MKKILLILILSLTLSAETMVHLTSWHSVEKSKGEWNDKNYGMSYKFDNNIKVGAYNNSFDKLTTYVGYEYPFNENLGCMIAVGTGYKSPVGASLYAKYQHMRVDLMPLPFGANGYGVALGFSVYF